MQLNLFQWDVHEISNGYSCLAALRFDQAKTHFSRVLTAQPTQATAQNGLQTAQFWQELLQQIEALPPAEEALLLWTNIQKQVFPANEFGRNFRLALIDTLRCQMEQHRLEFIEPDLCSGYLQFQLGNHVMAEAQLRRQIESNPNHGILYAFLADTLWLQDRCELANALYATALLVAPERMRNHRLPHRALSELVERHGVEMAPIHGFFQGLVPLVEPESPPDTPAVRAHSLLRQAEKARHEKDAAATQAAGERLRQHAPEVHAEYVRWLAGTDRALTANQ